jgi:hypothetical protein
MTLVKFYSVLDSIKPDEYGCHLWPGIRWKHPNDDRCWFVSIGKIKWLRVHRLALERKLGRPINPGLRALHHCDRNSCVNPEHLYEGTDKDNMRDRALRDPESLAANGRRRWNSPEGKAHLQRIREGWNNSPENKAHLQRIRESWNNSPDNKAHLKEIQSMGGKARWEKYLAARLKAKEMLATKEDWPKPPNVVGG